MSKLDLNYQNYKKSNLSNPTQTSKKKKKCLPRKQTSPPSFSPPSSFVHGYFSQICHDLILPTQTSKKKNVSPANKPLPLSSSLVSISPLRDILSTSIARIYRSLIKKWWLRRWIYWRRGKEWRFFTFYYSEF